MSWHDEAACRGKGHLFFHTNGNPSHAAKRICSTCPVIGPCAEAGRWEPYGVWGGLTETERGTRLRLVPSPMSMRGERRAS